MATIQQNPASPSRFSWFTFGKSPNASSDRTNESQLDDPWYIPYSGPVEPPREPLRRRLQRDSWGDPIERGEEEDITDVRKSYATETDFRHPFARGSQVPAIGTESQTGRIVRTQSVISARTLPSNSGRASVLSPRRLTITTTQRLPATQPPSGGVGESPMPPPIHHKTTSNERSGIAGFFSFSGKKTPFEKEPQGFPKISRKTELEQPSSRLGSAGHRRSASTGSNLSLGSGSNTRHPYSYVVPPSPGDNGPQTALLPSTDPIASSPTYVIAPTLTMPEKEASPQKSTGIAQRRIVMPRRSSSCKDIKGLKNSASTSDLHVGSGSNLAPQLRTKASSTSKIRERWLSAETWCDALLFPRPRLKMKKVGDKVATGRIVSLPPSPVNQSGHSKSSGVPEQGIASRVLVHSRSLADLNKAHKGPSIKELGISSWSTGLRPRINPPKEAKRTNQPRSWAFDDLALPAPVPSLAQVLEEGEKFGNQRQQWQDQATRSFQNKRTRSISRSRSKSLTNKRQKDNRSRPSNIDFLAASACLGSQILTPVVTEYSSNSSKITSSRTHSDHISGHWRVDLFGRTAHKKAKPVVLDNQGGSELFAANQLENALKGDSTKIIRLSDPALVPNSALTSDSPASPVSFVNDARIGIALTTPPLVDNLDGIETMPMSSHPYAQGGLYSFRSGAGVPGFDALDSPVKDLSKETNSNLPFNSISRVMEGPIAMSSYHPYAHKSSLGDAYLPDTKFTYSDASAPSRMWAQLSTGNIREVHPDDIQYSPFIGHEPEADDFIRNSRVINDTVGIGEALAFAVSPRTSKDSGLGTSEEYFTADSSYQVSSPALKESSRQPVQYDITRTPNLPLQTTDHDSAHTFASSPLLHQQQSASNLNVLRNTITTVQATQNNASPENFSRSLRSISDPDDLEGFYGLFYDLNRPTQHTASQMMYASASDTQSGMRRGAESELASLARQLSQELEQMTLEQEGGQYAGELKRSVSRKPTSSTLEFVFEETSSPGSEIFGLSPPGQHTIPPFQPSSAKVPEDVELSRASSPTEPNENATGEYFCVTQCPLLLTICSIEFRVGVVKSISTPVADVGPRVSLIDQKPFLVGHDSFEQDGSRQPRTKSPTADPTRSSYTTSSTMSRISTLSDFPAPPQRHAGENMPLSTSYFDQTHSPSKLHDLHTTTPLKPSMHDTIMGHFDEHGSDEEIEELVAALSSHSHSTVRHN
ncbi:hypothetical protein C0992_002462 [Termitomyces sp. T32_za158]|nr:hypothetical protein C0992_002462 [Termitomyces sp. T32_za158]